MLATSCRQAVFPRFGQLRKRQIDQSSYLEAVAASIPQPRSRDTVGPSQRRERLEKLLGNGHDNAGLPFTEQCYIPSALDLEIAKETYRTLDATFSQGDR